MGDKKKKILKISLSAVAILLAAIIIFLALAIIFNVKRLKSFKMVSIKDFFAQTKASIYAFPKQFLISYAFLLIASIAGISYLFYKNKLKTSLLKPNKYWYRNEIDNSGVSNETFDKKFKVAPNYAGNQNNANWVIKFDSNLNKWWVNEPESDINSVVLGGVGSGKTQRALLPNIIYNSHLRYKYRANFCIPDPKKEIIKMVGKKLEKQGYKIYAVDFSDTKKSVGWNPLSFAYKLAHRVPEGHPKWEDNMNEAISEINNVVEQLKWGNNSDGNPMWVDNAKLIVNVVAQFLLLLSIDRPDLLPERHFNLQSVASMCNLDAWNPKQKWISICYINAETNKRYYWAELFKNVKTIANIVPETLTGNLSHTTSALKNFTEDEFIKRLTRETKSFDLHGIVSSNEPYAIFIHYPDHKPSNHFLVSMLIDQIYQALIDCANSKEDLKLERKFFFMLDEAGNLPPILNLDNKVTISRSRNVFFQLVLQDYNQLKKYNTSTNHNVDSIIRSNLQFTYFLNSIDEKTLSDLSNSLGKKEVIKKSTSKSSSTSANGGSSSESESVEEKPLMSVAEIKAKNKEYAIIQKIGFLPMIVKTKLAYKYFSNDNYVFECDETENTVNESWNYQDLPDVELPVRNPIKNYDQLNDSSRAKKAREESLNKELNDKKVQKKLILEMQNARGSIKELSEYKDKISEWPKLALAWQKILSFQQKYKNKLSSELVNDFTKSINICLDQMNDIKTAGAKT